MAQSELNWLDKTIIALAELSVEETRVMIHVMKFALAMSFGLSFIFILSILKTIGVIGPLSLGGLPPPISTIFLFVFFYALIFFATHAVQEIEMVELSKHERWIFRAVGLGIFPFSWLVFALLFVWLGSLP
jgi:uncharacterized RDD family membrane protein YckC